MSAHLPLAIHSARSSFAEKALRKRNPLHRTTSAACDEWAYSPRAESSARRDERFRFCPRIRLAKPWRRASIPLGAKLSAGRSRDGKWRLFGA
jgi:hypothetical protein